MHKMQQEIDGVQIMKPLNRPWIIIVGVKTRLTTAAVQTAATGSALEVMLITLTVNVEKNT